MLASSAPSMPADFRTSLPIVFQVTVGAPTHTRASAETLKGCSHQTTSSPAGLSSDLLPAVTAGASPIIEATAEERRAIHCSTSHVSLATGIGSSAIL